MKTNPERKGISGWKLTKKSLQQSFQSEQSLLMQSVSEKQKSRMN
jgi:hypothetical protein